MPVMADVATFAEAKAAASRLFSRLDRDHDGTLDRRELRGRMVSKEFAAANRDQATAGLKVIAPPFMQ